MLSVPCRTSLYTKNLIINLSRRNFSAASSIQLKLQVNSNKTNSIRFLSSHEIFGEASKVNIDIPSPPPPAPPATPLEDLLASGESVLDELGLFTWWKPSSYLRWALEAVHIHFDVPWWGAIVGATLALRLATIFVPIMSQKLVAKQSKYKPELEEFRERMKDAQSEGNHLLLQQTLIEQRKFMKDKDIKLGRQFLVLIANGGIFTTQFFAIRGMANANYPGFSEGGLSWFTDLTAVDPIYALPIMSAVTLYAVMKVGVELGTSADQMTPAMKLGMLYGIPTIALITSTRFASAICLYWATSNVVSLIYSGMFKTPVIRKFFGIPSIVHHPEKPQKASAWKQAIEQYKAKKSSTPSLSSIREKDAELFKKAGRAKPIQPKN